MRSERSVKGCIHSGGGSALENDSHLGFVHEHVGFGESMNL